LIKQMSMKKDDKKGKYDEPFKPENTPEPPQVMNTSLPSDNADLHPDSGDKFTQGDPQEQLKKQERSNPKEKRLGESPSEIDDETTI
jgi:hypothetical protein